MLGHSGAAARCSLVFHPLGWELRLIMPDGVRSTVCETSEQILDAHERWKAGLLASGWRSVAAAD